ncbi:hypothetical protein [Kribbia dieselivorans]|uniref:hypothetical protein n=1 Tax=Kribbia dieselivorans TaxID=331526 RepID=UPI0008396972|nr:hypothetical protein [Kribbia dieselivorans]
MSDFMLRRYIQVRNAEKGQGTLEYVGMIIVAALVAVAVITAAQGTDFGGKFTAKVNEVLSK